MFVFATGSLLSMIYLFPTFVVFSVLNFIQAGNKKSLKLDFLTPADNLYFMEDNWQLIIRASIVDFYQQYSGGTRV